MRLYIYSHLKNGDYLFKGDGGEYSLDSDFYSEAFEFAKIFHDEQLSFETGMWSDAWYNAFRGDALLTSIQGIWLGGHLSSWIAPDQIQKFAMIQTPGDKSASWGGTHVFVTKNANMQNVKPVLDAIIGQTDKQNYIENNNEYGIESARIDMLSNYESDFFDDYFNQDNENEILKNSIKDIPIIRTHPMDHYAEYLVFQKYYPMILSEEITIENAIIEINQILADRLAKITIN
ncbi:MAG: hypothetical protein HRU38_05460 [Saccharospirillaceae bacterium]|nr:hypothetical protein [Pseudomonadales bacterium]NRB78104.1 hypothetical protein [Saccharospirillaceae bacterium]